MLTEREMLIAEVAFASGQSNGYASVKGLEPEISVEDWLADPELQIELSEALSNIPALTYTTELPTEPGPYLWKRYGGAVFAVTLRGPLPLSFFSPTSGSPLLALHAGGEWCRIPEPQE